MRFFCRPSVDSRVVQPSTIRRAVYLGALLFLFAATVSPASAGKPLPFRGRVTATWDNVFNGLFAPPANFTGFGPVTHLGNTKQKGTLTLRPSPTGIFPGFGSVTITAANGDLLSFDYVGSLNAGTGKGTGTFTFTGGTGRFRGATGGGTFVALIDVTVPAGQSMTVVLDGKIKY